MKDQNLAKIYVIVNTSVNPFTVENAGKDAGGENEGESRDVIEKNGRKMSTFYSLAMLLKKQGLFLVSRDVDENKGVTR